MARWNTNTTESHPNRGYTLWRDPVKQWRLNLVCSGSKVAMCIGMLIFRRRPPSWLFFKFFLSFNMPTHDALRSMRNPESDRELSIFTRVVAGKHFFFQKRFISPQDDFERNDGKGDKVRWHSPPLVRYMSQYFLSFFFFTVLLVEVSLIIRYP